MQLSCIILHVMDIHTCSQELHYVGLKSTPARLGILEALKLSRRPIDVSSLIVFLKKKKIQADRVTVFRIINIFTKKGIVIPIQFNEGKLRYEYASRPDHHHFICTSCGIVEDVLDCTMGEIIKNISKKKGLLVKRHALEFFGLCANCQ
jgi:Fur family transcriptional regulator, ferric uptake regulator